MRRTWGQSKLQWQIWKTLRKLVFQWCGRLRTQSQPRMEDEHGCLVGVRGRLRPSPAAQSRTSACRTCLSCRPAVSASYGLVVLGKTPNTRHADTLIELLSCAGLLAAHVFRETAEDVLLQRLSW